MNKSVNLICLFVLIVVYTMSFVGCKEDPDEKPGPGFEVKPLPIIYITTEGGAIIDSKETYVKGTFRFEGLGQWDDIAETDFEIRGRGNTTWGAPKKPYRMRFPNSNHMSLFGLPAARNWVLLANYYDKSNLYNALGFELAKRLDMPFTNSFHFVELYLNGEWQGLYMVTEHLKGNVTVGDEDLFMELDNNMDEAYQFYSDLLELPVMICSPESQAGIDKARAVWSEIENKFYLPNILDTPPVLDSNNGWWELFDIQSIINYAIVNSASYNREAGWMNSVYMRWYENTNKMHFGPVWDFDAAGMDLPKPEYLKIMTYQNDYLTIPLRGTAGEKLICRFFDDPKFDKLYKEEIAKAIQIGKLDVTRFIDSLVTILKPYADADNQKWHPEVDFITNIGYFKSDYQLRMQQLRNYSELNEKNKK